MEEHGDASASSGGNIAEENVDVKVTTKEKRKQLNCSQKVALGFLGIFMGIVVASFVLYICLFVAVFKNIFKLENMILVFCGFLLVCFLYVTCCIVGVTMVIQAKSKKHLNLFQVAMFGIVFLNVLSPTLTLHGSFGECSAKPKMMPCPQLCQIHTSILAMTGLAFFCIILKIALSSLWNGIERKDVYANLFLEDDEAPRSSSGFNGMIPMFDISISEYEDLIYEDTKEFSSDPSKNDVVVHLLPEHSGFDNDEINYSGLTTAVQPISSDKHKTSLEDKPTIKKDATTLSKTPERIKYVPTATAAIEHSATKVETIPKVSSKGFDTAVGNKQPSENLHKTPSKDSKLHTGAREFSFSSTVDKAIASKATAKKQIGFSVTNSVVSTPNSPNNENSKVPENKTTENKAPENKSSDTISKNKPEKK